MGDTWVTDIRHYLDENDDLIREPGLARRLAEYQCSIIAAVTARPPDEVDWGTDIRCRRRPRRKPCEGQLIAGINERDPSTLVRLCPFCGDNGYLRGWEGTWWDLR